MSKKEMTVDEWLNNEELPITIWKNKYQQNNETFEQWLDRVSGSNEDVKELIREKKFIFGGRILSNRGVKGRSLTYSNCFTGDTKIMTDNGLKTLKECYDKGAKINVLSKTAWRTAEVKYFGVRPIKELTLRKGSSVRKFYVTGNHQWFVKNKKSGKEILKITDELCVGDVIPTEVMKCYKTYKPNPIGVAHGFFTGDGDHAERDNYRVNICKGKEDILPYYMPDTLGHSGEVITVYGMPKFFSHYPSLQESKSYLYGWLAGYFAADGSIDERGACVICSTKIKDLEYVQNVLCVLGIPSSEIRYQDRISNLTGEEGRVYILSLNKKYLNATFFVREKHRKRFVEHPFKNDYDWKVDKVVDMGISSPVYCAVVPETQSFTLDGGIKTHNCYVLTPPEDNLESIFETGSKLARTFSYGGGCGIDVSKLRPKGAPVNNAAKSTTGTTSFMDFYSYITGLIGQEGRRGATMISISCEHPDLIEFINLKSNLDVCTKANISVRVTDAFMQAVEKDSDFTLHFTMEDGSEIKKVINAREVFMLLAKRNWEMAEPGMLYWDRISQYNLLQNSGFEYAGVNPCAEEPLPAGGSCLLGSINLSEFVIEPFTDGAYIDYESLEDATMTAIRALNDVLMEGLSLHPLQEQRESVGNWRQIGLGTLGLGDMLIMLGLKYGSKESLEVIEQVYNEIATNSILASLELAKERGAFPECTKAIKQAIITSDFVRNLNLPLVTIDEIQRNGLYNSQLLTCAPTGSIGTMLQVSTGVEPNYAFSYNRRTVSLNNEETTYLVDAKIVSDFKRVTGRNDLPEYFVSSSDINYKDRIAVQSMLQRYIDASISSTINLPNSCTVEEVADIYMEAWKQGLKGVTIWRDGCQREGILSTGKKEEKKEESKPKDKNVFVPTEVKKTSDDCIGRKRTLVTGCGTLHLTGFFCRHTGQLLETYFSKGSQGGCALFMVGLSRMVSLAARANVSIEKIIDQLMSSGTCPSYAVRRATKKDTSKGSSCPVAIGFALMDMYNEIQKELNIKPVDEVENYSPSIEVENPKCPKCGEELSMVEGCMTCPSCGYSKCN